MHVAREPGPHIGDHRRSEQPTAAAPEPSRWWTVLLAVAGGLATETAFPARSWWPMAYLGVAVLLLALRRDSARWGFVVGLLYGLAFFLPHVWWANEAVGQPIGWVALSVSQAVYMGVFGAVWARVRRRAWVGRHAWLQVVGVAVLWVGVEQVRGRWPFGGFPWGTLAFSQTEAPLLRLAPVGGETLVSAVVVALAALLAMALTSLRRLRMVRAGAALVVAAAVLLLPTMVPQETRAESGTLWVGAVQGNVPQQGAEAMSQARAVAANHAAGTEALLGQGAPEELDLVLWPESASDIDPRTDPGVAADVDAAARAVVQISTVGVSALIRPDGVVLEQTGLFTAEQMIGELPLRTSITLADRLGEWPALVVGVLAVSLLALGVVSRPEAAAAGESRGPWRRTGEPSRLALTTMRRTSRHLMVKTAHHSHTSHVNQSCPTGHQWSASDLPERGRRDTAHSSHATSLRGCAGDASPSPSQ